ncbi:AMP-binding protein [Saccharopolyspora hattusasensis]|uniref:AMP-binding protein n=1 Tax=Saccharopolyspora hattusasensis TaxID=1128679 RepID=UPI003D98697C
MIAAVGILCAGGVYVPVGVEHPCLRRERIYADAEVRVVIDETGDGLYLPTALRADPLAEPVPVEPDALAYVIFTSGSTGSPKGVEITRDSAVNTIADINARYSVGAHDRMLAVSTLDFDLSVYDVFGDPARRSGRALCCAGVHPGMGLVYTRLIPQRRRRRARAMTHTGPYQQPGPR